MMVLLVLQYFTLHSLMNRCNNLTIVQFFEAYCENKIHVQQFSAVIDVTALFESGN